MFRLAPGQEGLVAVFHLGSIDIDLRTAIVAAMLHWNDARTRLLRMGRDKNVFNAGKQIKTDK